MSGGGFEQCERCHEYKYSVGHKRPDRYGGLWLCDQCAAAIDAARSLSSDTTVQP